MLDESQLTKELTQIRGRLGINDQNIPNGNGLLGHIENLEKKFNQIDQKLDGMITTRWIKERLIALASIATAITVLIVFYEKYIKGGV